MIVFVVISVKKVLLFQELATNHHTGRLLDCKCHLKGKFLLKKSRIDHMVRRFDASAPELWVQIRRIYVSFLCKFTSEMHFYQQPLQPLQKILREKIVLRKISASLAPTSAILPEISLSFANVDRKCSRTSAFTNNAGSIIFQRKIRHFYEAQPKNCY